MKKLLSTCFLLGALQVAAVEIDLKEYKVKGDGKTYCTKALQQAIDDCHKAGGGRVTIPDGTFLIGAIWMRDNVELHLSKMTTLLAGTNREQDYPSDAVALIHMNGVKNVALTGFGTIDGQGKHPTFNTGDNPGGKGRPIRYNILRATGSSDIRIHDVSMVNSGFWTLRLRESEEIMVRGVKIYSFANHNNDGIDIDARNVTISDCLVYAEDDALCFKSDSRNHSFIVENITVTNCVLASNCNAIKFGTSGYAGFRNITISNCVVRRAPTWIVKDRTKILGIKTPESNEMGIALEVVDGGFMENVTISNIAMSGVMTPIFIRFGNRRNTPQYLRNVVISNIVAESEGYMCSSITGVPGCRVDGVTLRDIVIRSMGTGTAEFAEKPVPEKEKGYPQNTMFGHTLPAHGLYVRHADNITMENVQFLLDSADARPAIVMDDVSNVWINNFQGGNSDSGLPFLRLTDARKVSVSGFRQHAGAPELFLEATGASQAIRLWGGNDFDGVKTVAKAAEGVVTPL